MGHVKPTLPIRLFLWQLRRMARGGTGGMPGARISAEALARLRAVTGRPSFPESLSALQIRAWREIWVPGAEGMLRARVYRPYSKPRGTILFLHGGGFVHCDLVSHHGICCRLARQSGALVVSLDYRLAPEHKFPAAVEDGWAALQWLGVQMRGRGGIAVAGDSAGGNLAAVLAQRARDRGGPVLAGQVLFYPTVTGAEAPVSRTAYASGYFLSASAMEWYCAQYLTREEELRDPAFAPALAGSFEGLPPCAILTAGFDPLRGEGERYRDLLRGAGVPVLYRCYTRMIHGFLNGYAVLPEGRAAIRVGARFLRRVLRG